jgi:hypothetical protein
MLQEETTDCPVCHVNGFQHRPDCENKPYIDSALIADSEVAHWPDWKLLLAKMAILWCVSSGIVMVLMAIGALIKAVVGIN